ncbi:MAG: ferrous iron transport protein B [Desulfobacteraceae bacterium]|nr:ferrous iron transport protein B [Desulfobacteraceae bacterium]
MTSNPISVNKDKQITVALAGQPNTGKSTLFNSLTGSNQHVGNWPGKTIEQKSGYLTRNDTVYTIVDLPGTYSLSANSPEEIIARNFIMEGNSDLIIAVVDASQLERSLYMAAEVMSLGVPVILALNMMDVAEHQHLQIDVKHLEESLGIKVIAMTASRNRGISDLTGAIEDVAGWGGSNNSVKFEFNEESSLLLESLKSGINGSVPAPYKEEWVALKLMENDKEITGIMKKRLGRDQWETMTRDLGLDGQGLLAVANARYKWVAKLLNGCVKQPALDNSQRTRTRFDILATHPIWGGILGITILLIGFCLAGLLGSVGFFALLPLTGHITQIIQTSFLNTMPIFTAMICQGIVPGIFMVFGMSSFVFGVLLLIGFLEDIGYLPRMAYVADGFMNRIGLHGKSFMPLFMGFGCNIAAVMGSRVIDSARQRFMTIVLASLIPCSGLMVTIAFMVTIFFGPVAPLVVLAMAAAILLQLFLTSFLLGHTVLPGKSTGMIMELPPYHRPNWRTIRNYVWIHYKSYLKKGGSLIMYIIIIVWALSYFPNGNIDESYLASTGKALEPFGRLMGMDWKLLTCLFVAFFSKEAAISSMAVIYGLNMADGSLMGVMMENIAHGHAISNNELGRFLAGSISSASAIAFIFAILFSVPCFATVGVIYSETKSLKWTLGSVTYYTSLSFLWGIIAYNTGLFLF